MAVFDPHPLDISAPGGVVINPHSEYGKELRRWDLPKSRGGMNADGYEEYPRMLYQAIDPGNGKPEVHRMPPPRYAYPTGREGDEIWTQACVMAEEFTRRCQRIVHSEGEKAIAMGQGWCLTQDGALTDFEHRQQVIGNAAAERLASDRRMSEKAKAEAAAADASTHAHVADVIGSSKKTRGRKPKIKAVTS